MKTKSLKKRLTVWAIIVAGILLIPLLTRAPWTGSDFVFAGIVLFGLAAIYEFATKNITSRKYRIAVGLVLLAVLVLIQAWAAAGPD